MDKLFFEWCVLCSSIVGPMGIRLSNSCSSDKLICRCIGTCTTSHMTLSSKSLKWAIRQVLATVMLTLELLKNKTKQKLMKVSYFLLKLGERG